MITFLYRFNFQLFNRGFRLIREEYFRCFYFDQEVPLKFVWLFHNCCLRCLRGIGSNQISSVGLLILCQSEMAEQTRIYSLHFTKHQFNFK